MAAFWTDDLGGWGMCMGGHPEKALLEPLRKKASIWSRPGSPLLSGRQPSRAKQGLPRDPSRRRSEHRGDLRAQQRTLNFFPIPCPSSSHDQRLPSRLLSPPAASELFSKEHSGNHHTDGNDPINEPIFPLSQVLEAKV